MSNITNNDEAMARLRRIETRLFRVSEHIGLPEESNTPLEVSLDKPSNTAHLVIPGYDVTLSSIKKVLKYAGLENVDAVHIFHGDKRESLGIFVFNTDKITG